MSRTLFGENPRASIRPAAWRWVTLWDGRQVIGWEHHGMPVFRYRCAPAGLATRRQLRGLRLCPGGQEPYGLLVWRNGQRWAWLWRLDLARPSRVSSPAQLNALDKAMAARRHCRQCQRYVDYCVPTSDGRCADCIHATDAVSATGAEGNEWASGNECKTDEWGRAA